jgi:SAM-dependent methyltransferase
MQDERCLSVSPDRWRKAQEWERAFWIREQKQLAKYGKNIAWRLLALVGKVEKYRGDDRNRWWKAGFDDYSFLPPRVDNALEVGCGPYTNMRLIRTICKPDHIALSDPLIRTYVGFKMTFVREMYESAGCLLDDHPLEELPFANGYFDLAVMINVLDHVRDLEACMHNLTRVVKPGGIVVIGQDLTNEDDAKAHPVGLKIGHPLIIDENWFDPYLRQFTEIYRRIIPRERGWAPQWHYGTLCYAGRKQ